jgi:putative DNA primase/helicase
VLDHHREDPEPFDAREEKVPAISLDPVPAARRFINDTAMHRERGAKICRLRYWRGEFWLWHLAQGRYVRISNDAVRANVTYNLDRYAKFITSGIKSNIVDHVRALTIIDDSTEMPSWIERPESHLPADELLATKSGLIHLPTFLDGGADYVLQHTPRFFSENALDYAFDASAPAPAAWLTFLSQLWPNDAESIATLQEWMGLFLTSDTRHQKILVMVGPRRSGKGTIARVVRGLVGPDNVAGPTLAGLGTNFGLWPLIGKTVAVISDARLSGRTDAAIVTERLLSISGEDAQTIDRKCLKAVTTKLAVRFVILTNELMRLGDSSGALVGRMIVLRLTESFYGREDQKLTDKLLVERPGILLWALEGLRRLRVRGHFVQPATGRELIGARRLVVAGERVPSGVLHRRSESGSTATRPVQRLAFLVRSQREIRDG